MTRLTITRRLTFAAGHRVWGHESKCAHLHGHNYVAEIEAVGALDALGRVVDFSVIKDRVGAWIDAQWDHGLILYRQDSAARRAVDVFDTLMPTGFTQKLYLMEANPTAENLARELAGVASALLADTGVRVCAVRIHETENCVATYGEV